MSRGCLGGRYNKPQLWGRITFLYYAWHTVEQKTVRNSHMNSNCNEDVAIAALKASLIWCTWSKQQKWLHLQMSRWPWEESTMSTSQPEQGPVYISCGCLYVGLEGVCPVKYPASQTWRMPQDKEVLPYHRLPGWGKWPILCILLFWHSDIDRIYIIFILYEISCVLK
jgi:hypothetical protein